MYRHPTENGEAELIEAVIKKDEEDDASLIAAVFEHVRLPEVRFVEAEMEQQLQKDNTTMAADSPGVPPNSARTEEEEAETDAAPRRPMRQRQTPRNVDGTQLDLLHDGVDEDAATDVSEDMSLHLLAHKDSLERAQQPSGHIPPRRSSTRMSLETGDAVPYSPRSVDATMAEETPRSDGHEAEDEGGGEEAEEEEAERKGSGGSSSTLSRELIHSTVEQALQNCCNGQNGHKPDEAGEGEEQHDQQDQQAKLRDRSAFQLELDKRVGQRLSASSHSLSGQSSPSAPAPPVVHVRTPLNDPASPFRYKAYTPYEPDKQEQIRREIGDIGIRQMVNRFQQQQQRKVVVEDEESEDEKAEIVAEQQRPVADILAKFTQRSFVHPTTANGGVKDEEGNRQPRRPTSIGPVAGSRIAVSVWSNSSQRYGQQQNRESPAPGSLAAIRKSLAGHQQQNGGGGGTTVAASVASSDCGSAASSDNGAAGDNGGRTKVTTPKNVSEFYRLWGQAQAKTPAPVVKPPSPVSSGGSPFSATHRC